MNDIFRKLMAALGAAAIAVSAAAQDEPEPAPTPATATEAPDYTAHILTPPAPDTPRLTGPRIFGVRPGNPFLFTVTATGKRPMTFGAEGLPDGLLLDNVRGRITGKILRPGTYRVKLSARNALGRDTRDFRIVCGDRLALTPPMGWNSWNAGGPHISTEKILANAKAMVDTGLVHHGWQYINIDDAWQGKRGGKHNAIQGNEKFPDMKKLADDVHAMGLKIGIYSTPWVTSYAGFVGGSSDDEKGHWDENTGRDAQGRRPRQHGKHSFAWADARQWAEWGIDYLKYDWNPMSMPGGPSADMDVSHLREMADALRYSGRDIVYSYSNSAPFSHVGQWAVHTHLWRNTGDIRDHWHSMASKGFDKDKWAPFAGPGHWNDPDMLVVGLVGWRGALANTKLTPDEQYTHISLWSLVGSPLLIGCDMTRLDPFTISLLSNDEVLDVNQDPLGHQGITVSQIENPDDPGMERVLDPYRGENDPRRWVEMPKYLEVVAKRMEDGSKAAGLFNRGTKPAKVTLRIEDLRKIDAAFGRRWDEAKKADAAYKGGKWRVRDLWRQKDLGVFEGEFSAEVNPHGVVMVQLFEEK